MKNKIFFVFLAVFVIIAVLTASFLFLKTEKKAPVTKVKTEDIITQKPESKKDKKETLEALLDNQANLKDQKLEEKKAPSDQETLRTLESLMSQ